MADATTTNTGHETGESQKCKPKDRGRKRRRISSSSSDESLLPDNALELEKRIHESAIKNNLDSNSVRKIIKKVVSNDHVLAMVQLQAEEEEATDKGESPRPAKLTRAKAKELMKVSPKSTKWNLENLELTPIKHIPVKTRPEVKALIAQELPEDEDDEEYEPTNDDVMSDDDQTLESCSDLDSQPRTPATPRSMRSPAVVTDGPFKVPQESITPVRRRLQTEIEEDKATIALRTRSKLCLFDTSIEHIESNFVPPDDLPPVVDHLWTDFLQDCLDPAQTSRHEEDDEADPEYSVAGDPDTDEEDDGTDNYLKMRVSQKELNDLVTELFHLMPEEIPDISPCIDVTNGKGPENGTVSLEPFTDQDLEKRNATASATEPVAEDTAVEERTTDQPTDNNTSESNKSGPPAPLVTFAQEQAKQNVHEILIDTPHTVLPDQVALIQQQMRMHVQLAASNFLQLYVNPAHWSLAPTYKEYLETLSNLAEKNPTTVANVCNLKPAFELVRSWEESVSENTPRNAEMVEFIQKENERMTRRYSQHSTFAGEFHPIFKDTIANSRVFLYPHLLPNGPYFAEFKRRVTYCVHEDRFIALGLEQFFSYVQSNPEIYKNCASDSVPGRRRGLSATLQLVQKHMVPWVTLKNLTGHVQHVRRVDKNNPITKYLLENIIQPPQHRLLPFDPKLTLYERPETEMPRLWIKHLAKTSKKFKNRLYARHSKVIVPEGVPLNLTSVTEPPKQFPLPTPTEPISQTETENTNRVHVLVAPTNQAPTNVFQVLHTDKGTVFIPVNSNPPPLDTTNEIQNTTRTLENNNHCDCCILLNCLCPKKQYLITDFFKPKTEIIKPCHCTSRRRPMITRRLKYLVNFYRTNLIRSHSLIKSRLEVMKYVARCNLVADEETSSSDKEEFEYALSYQIRLTSQLSIARNRYTKAKVIKIFSSFDPELDDPIDLAADIKKVLDTELIDLYKEFISFLTDEQADKIGAFRDYFKHYCVVGLLERIDKEITCKEDKAAVLKQLEAMYSDYISRACQMCSNLLNTMCGYPKLAEYTFSLFPHTRIRLAKLITTEPKGTQKEPTPVAVHDKTLTNEDVAMNSTDYNSKTVDLNTSDEDGSDSTSESEETEDKRNKSAEESVIDDTTQNIAINTDLNHTNTQQVQETTQVTNEQNSDSGSEMSMMIMSDDEPIMTEPPEWHRNEDKLILETIKDKLTPEEQTDKTILDIIQQNDVLTLLSNGLPDKTIDDIKDRIKYLMYLLNNNE